MTIYDIQVHTIDGTPTTLAAFRNQVLLIVNVASKCGFTPQYRGLEQLYRQYQSHGFAVLAFPCNQFGYQEPDDADEIKNFCSLNYDISFPLFAKVEVNGRHAHPLFEHLKSTQPGVLGTEAIKWNFTKFLVDRQGQVIKRYAPTETPESMSQEIEHLLQAT